jgi:hypothetical protein
VSIVLVPLVLMLIKTLSELVPPDGSFAGSVLNSIGHPFPATVLAIGPLL